jgi:Caspase domain
VAERLAFLIGNQTFRSDSGLLPLQGPANDVAALGRLLRDPGRGRFTVREYLNKTHDGILPELDQALGAAERGDLFLIYYSGHGKLDRQGRLCLATADTRQNALITTSIPARHLRDLVEESDCDQVVLLLDCCYSGAVEDGLRGDVTSALHTVEDARGFYIMTASTGLQAAREMAVAPGGAVMGRFTAAIVSGIESGAADAGQKGKILVSDLRRYLSRVIKGQTPQFFDRKASGDPLISFSPAAATSSLEEMPPALEVPHKGTSPLRPPQGRHRYVAIGLTAPAILVGCVLLFTFVIRPAYNSHQQAEVPLAVSQAAESTKDTTNPSSRGANIRKELTSHGDIVDIAVEPKDIWVLAAKPIPNGTHRNGDGSLFPDSDIFIVHVTSEAVTSNKFTVLPFQKREPENDLLPDAIIYRDGDYVYCFVNSLVGEHGYKMHGQIYEFDPSNLEVKSSYELFDGENWGWFPRFIKQEGLIKHWSSGPGYHWVLGSTVLKDVQIPRSVAALEFKNYQVIKSEGILPAAPSDVINKIVDLAVRGFKRR